MKKKRYKLYSAMYILLIASLPLFSVRFSFLSGGSLSLYILIIISLVSFMSLVITGKMKKVLSGFDLFIAFLITASILSILLKDTSDHHLAIFKTIVYFTVYLSLKLILFQLPIENIEKITLKGIYFGLAVFSIIISYAILQAGGIIHLLSSFDYFNFTYKIFEQINLLTSNRDFSSRDIMRNALGEVFAFYFMFLLIIKNNQNKSIKNWGSIFLSILYVIITFSRRAFLASVITLFLILTRYSKKNIYSSIFLFISLSVIIYLFIFSFSDESRLTSITISGRSTQFELALASLSDSFFFGKGYGEKLMIPSLGEKIYIHNFILSNFYMLGIVGLILSFSVFMRIVFLYIKAIKKSTPHYNLLLLIPLMGMLVGGTTEGMFTITSWIILALTEFNSMKNNSNRAF